MRQDFILNDWAIVPNVDMFNGHRRHFRQEDTAECICDRSVNTDQIEHDFFVGQVLDFDRKACFKIVEERSAAFAFIVGLQSRSIMSIHTKTWKVSCEAQRDRANNLLLSLSLRYYSYHMWRIRADADYLLHAPWIVIAGTDVGPFLSEMPNHTWRWWTWELIGLHLLCHLSSNSDTFDRAMRTYGDICFTSQNVQVHAHGLESRCLKDLPVIAPYNSWKHSEKAMVVACYTDGRQIMYIYIDKCQATLWCVTWWLTVPCPPVRNGPRYDEEIPSGGIWPFGTLERHCGTKGISP